MTRQRAAIYAAFAAAVALAMGLCLQNGFVYDDLPAIVTNTRVTDPSRWHTIPRAPYWLGTLWRPFTVSMYAVQWALGGGAAWVFHGVSLLAYCVVGVLLFRLMADGLVAGGWGLLRGRDPLTVASESGFLSRNSPQPPATSLYAVPAAAVFLFLVHPVHVEAVANAVGQAELWVGMALLVATFIYVRARTAGTEGRALVPLLVAVALGIMAKEQGFVAPLILGGAEWLLFANRREPLHTRLRLLVPVTALAGLLFVVRAILLNDPVGETPAVALRMLSPLGRAVTFLGVVPEWARLLVWPRHLQADYGPPGIPIGDVMTARQWIGLALVVAFIALFVRVRRTAPVAAFGLCWMAVALAPVSNLLTPSGLVMAERVLFVPSIGFAIAGAALVLQYASSPGQLRFAAVVAVIWGSMLAVRSVRRVPTWQSQESFFTAITIDGERAYRGWKVAAEYWDDRGNRPLAIEQLKHSIDLWPHDYEVAEKLGQIYRQDGHCDMAIPVFRAGLAEDSSATSLRAKLVECLITVKDFDGAEKIADAGVALGYDEFKPMQVRVKKVRATSSEPPL